jgi:hypothetical protein
MRIPKPALALAVLLAPIGLAACYADYYGPPPAYADVDYDAYYDGYYGPFYGGYWGPGGYFYYSDQGGHHFHRDTAGHFRRGGGGGGFSAVHGHAPMAGGRGGWNH